MKQWEIFTFEFPQAGSHPAVIVSHPATVANKQYVNILYCSSQRATRRPEPPEVLLDEADGLEWQTLCRCDALFLVDKRHLTVQRGTVIPARQVQIVQKIIASFGWRLY